MIDSPTVLPTDEFFPDEYDATQNAAADLVERVCGYMRVPSDLVAVEVFRHGRPRAGARAVARREPPLSRRH